MVNDFLMDNCKPVSNFGSKGSVESLALQWAKKYMYNLAVEEDEETKDPNDLAIVVSQAGREKTAYKLMESLRSISAKAWNKTEALLAREVKRHRIDPTLINPWEIAADSFGIYQKALNVYRQQTVSRPLSLVMKLANEGNPLYEQALQIYTEQVAPCQLSTVISSEVGAVRKKYTSVDPRVIGFVSMQFHYTSQSLLDMLSPTEGILVGAYFKVIDDHLYMPLQRAYDAAAKHDYESNALVAVQKLLPASTQIAKKIACRVIKMYPNYRSYTGLLSEGVVKVASIRDVEMFQVYLWVCALEGNIAAIQQELFPLCVMLYPTLNVQWEIVRQMLYLLGQEIRTILTPTEANALIPYYQVMWHMFSPEVFGEFALEKKSNLTDNGDLWETLFAT
jgi:hypothetical protein